MRLDLTKHDVQLLVDALSQPTGVVKSFRKDAERLRERLQFQLGVSHAPPPAKNFTPIKSRFPDNFVKPDKRKDWSFDKPRKAKAVESNNSNGQAAIDKVLEGLI